MHAWTFLTNFGDSAVTLPLAVAVLALFALSGSLSLLRGWLLVVALCGFSVALLKIGFSDCAAAGPLGRPFSPSGHTAMSTLVYGGLALLASAGRPPGVRLVALIPALALALAIGVSRVVVHAHSPSEVVAGFAIGGGALLLLHRATARATLRGSPLALIAVALVVALAMHGTRWPIEQQLQRLAALLHRDVPVCS
ncbi:PAP2 superfamily protein [mine drainage metagenome]|uniref:PAP2 superfamily protein n=1 Tax=mine drainage metagenome TaxID=410659 RepID=A0A1J5PVA5_9ZZZZ